MVSISILSFKNPLHAWAMPTLSMLDYKSLLIREWDSACLNLSVAALVSDPSYQKVISMYTENHIIFISSVDHRAFHK